MSDPLPPPSPRSRNEEVRDWVEAILGAQLPLLVTELHCTKAECPTVETVIAVLAKGAQRRWSIPVPLAALAREQVEDALRGRPRGDGGARHAPPGGGAP